MEMKSTKETPRRTYWKRSQKMRGILQFAVLAGLVATVGCASTSGGVSPYRAVDLGRDLSQSALLRYQGEMKGMDHSQHGDHSMMTLERTNWWALGLAAYWHRGTVRAMHGAGGVHYMVSQTRGIGPLALGWVSKEQALYTGEGKRLQYMNMGSMAWGHVAMIHTMGGAMGEGGWMEHKSYHLLHHLLNLGEAHGGMSVNLGSSPNPMGFGE